MLGFFAGTVIVELIRKTKGYWVLYVPSIVTGAARLNLQVESRSLTLFAFGG